MGKKNTMEFMKIHQYVMDLIVTGDDKPQKILSSRKLGEMFGVTHPTALRAIQNLTESGLLTPCKSGGSMTCPGRSVLKKMKIIALLMENGRLAFEIYYHHRIKSPLERELTRRSTRFCTQDIILDRQADLEHAIAEHPFAGLILVGIHYKKFLPYIQKLQEKNFPVASYMGSLPGVPSILFDHEEYYELALKTMFSEKRTRLYLSSIPDFTGHAEMMSAIRKCCAQYGVPETDIIVGEKGLEQNSRDLEARILNGERFDGIIGIRNINTIYDLRKKYPVLENCRFLNIDHAVYDDMNFSGYVISPDYEAAAKQLLDNFLPRVDGIETPPLNEKIKLHLALRINGKETKQVQ